MAWTRWRLILPVGILEKLGAGMAQTTVEIACEGEPPDPLVLRIRPEHVVPFDKSNA
jgi:hypothetical protein